LPVNYRGIEGFPGYRVGDDGSVWSHHGFGGSSKTYKRLKTNLVRNYLQISLYIDGVPHYRRVHVLVLEAFIGRRPTGMQCCHFPDPDPANCRLENLRWGTHAENLEHKKIHGTHLFGESMPNAKLTDDDVRYIRRNYRPKKVPLRVFAEKFGVTHQVVHRALLGVTWKHVSLMKDGET